ncbi:segregation/condensation protein A [Mycoplasmatota bacterium]|nr:segregation/condensation protein A [Mycoplasmatota bacterium]
MEYQVKIDEFEGPLDLLLYLIKETKISIDKINVSEITQQYIDFIHAMEELNLEIASEYLVMAAYLTFIKSKMMLPKANLENEEIDYEENPEEKLKMRLKVYKLFKDVVPYFKEQEEERNYYITKIPTDFSNEFKLDVKEVLAQNANVYDLLSAFNKVMKRYHLHQPLKTKIKPQTITIDERIIQLKKAIKEKKKLLFTELFTSHDSKEFIVTTFMAILELAKDKIINIKQDELFTDIYLDYIENEEERVEVYE